MAISSIISPKELRRLAVRAYEGKTLWVRLASLTTEDYDANTLVSLWRTIELPLVAGYAPFSAVIQPGTYSATNGRWEIPAIDAPFVATGTVYTYNRILLYIDDYVLESANTVTGTNISFQGSGTNTITQTTGNFTTNFNANEYVKVSGSSGNDGVYQITSVSALSITLNAITALPLTLAAGPSVTLTRALLYPYAILEESPNITLIDGQTQTYRINLNTDDG